MGKHFYWGPFVGKYELSKDLCSELKRRGDICKQEQIYANKALAGHFKTEYYFKDEDVEWFTENTQNIFTEYFEERKWWHNGEENDIKVKLTPMWINYMKAGDFNPIHTHTEDLSFVLFLDVPEELVRENKEERNNDTHGGPGALIFLNGEVTDWSISSNTVFPQQGEMFIFPAKLRHMVYPFKSKVERVSVSGNLKFI